MYQPMGFLLVCLEMAWGRESNKPFRSMPAISNSLVNLGKMDISFHFNTRGSDPSSPSVRTDHITQAANPLYFPRPDQVDIEPCPCSTVKNFKNPFANNPSDIINKILRSNDLFSFNQEPVISTMCCDSHEHVQEDTVFFEFNPKTHIDGISAPLQPDLPLPSLPKIIDNFFQAKAPLPTVMNKPKAIEILFFPKKKETPFDFSKMLPKKKEVRKTEIQVVGDKELRNDFKNFKYRPTFPILFRQDEAFEKNREEKLKQNKAEEKVPVEKVLEDKVPVEDIKAEEKVDEGEESVTKTDNTTHSSPNAL